MAGHVQRPDGSWHNYYFAERVEDSSSTPTCAPSRRRRVAPLALTRTGASVGACGRRRRAIDWVLEPQTADREVVWACEPDGRPWTTPS